LFFLIISKPSPLIGVLGLIDKKPLRPQKIVKGDKLILIGDTKNELGGSEYFEYIHNFIGGQAPEVDFKKSKQNMDFVLDIIKKNNVAVAHDCSKGGLAIAISELCMQNDIGCNVSLAKVPGEKLSIDRLLFSESHSRYLLVVKNQNLKKINQDLKKKKISFNVMGTFEGDQILFRKGSKTSIALNVDKAKKVWLNSLKELVIHG